MTTSEPALDFIAIGLGPFNLSLACLMAPLTEHRGLFLEQSGEFSWHPGMMIDDSTLQNPFLADLVTLADPTSRFSYLNFCKAHGRLFSYFIRENYYLSRQEYNRYCRWAASKLTSVRFAHEVLAIHFDPRTATYRVEGLRGQSRQPFAFYCRRLVIGIGAAPAFPACCEDTEQLVHTANYLKHKERLQSGGSITVIGSGQSAAEVYCDLLRESDRHDYALHWITRSPRFFAMDTNRLALELLCPDYIEHFFGLDEAVKARVSREHRSIYNGINVKLINEVHELLAERRREGRFEGHLLSNAELRDCRFDHARCEHELTFFHSELQRGFRHRSAGVVLGTGYSPCIPSFIEPIRDRIHWDAQGRYAQARNYAVDSEGAAIFVQNAGFQRHGFTSPDLSLACHRNVELIRAITGVAYYEIEYGTALQDFAPPMESPWFEFVTDAPAAR